MRNAHTPLLDVVDSFLVHRHDLSPATATNYRHAIHGFSEWCEQSLERPVEVGDVEPGMVEAYLAFRKTTGSAQCARVAWVALRSLARFLAERRIQHEHGESTLRLVRMPRVKDEARRALTDDEMWRLIQRAAEGETGYRDSTIVWTLLGCGLRREELANLRLGDVDLRERRLHIRAATSKSVHSRDVTIPIEALKALDGYVADHRQGDADQDDPLFTDRRGRALTGNAVRKLFERLKARTGIHDLCAHMLRHTWGDQLPPLRLRLALRPYGRGRLDDRPDGGALHQGEALRGAPPSTVTIHRGTQGGQREAAFRDAATTAEKGPRGHRHRVERSKDGTCSPDGIRTRDLLLERETP
jgi:site-specific recombinase XerD